MAKKTGFEKSKEEMLNLSEGKRERALRLLEKAIFMEAEMNKLQNLLLEKGWTEGYQNGENQRGMKRSANADVYLTLTKNYLATMKQINDMIPDSKNANNDELLEFLQTR